MTAPSGGGSGSSRTVQETDLYRLDGNHLYYLNSYRGLMVFDVTNVDQPKLLGRSPIFGSPIQMFVTNGIAVVVVADWYGTVIDLNGVEKPFHGSIVRGLDATDPANIKVLGEAPLGGNIQDTRVVGSVLYAVSEDYGWTYGWGGPYAGGVAVSPGTYTGPDVIVSSVSFANGQIQQKASKKYSGYGGVFNVTQNAIMLAHPAPPVQPGLPAPAQTVLQYLDITDPLGTIVERGSITVDGSVTGWGADNGRWNLDFADGKTAHVLGCGSQGCGSGYVLSIADFTNPSAPKIDAQVPIAANGWTPATRFDGTRMYLSPSGYTSAGGMTPLEIYDMSNPTAPKLASTQPIPGSVWLMIPSGNQLFALGQDNTANASQVSLKYLDVTNPTMPTLIGTSNFGDGWAWTPAASTFKAFTHDPTQGLVVLPFSGWSRTVQQYNNGVQLIEFTPTSIMTAGAAHTKGWVERGIFANGRILSLSDLALSVVDYSDKLAPKVTAELTLARNVIAAQPAGTQIAQVSSSDWWGNQTSTSDVRILPISDSSEIKDESAATDVPVAGVNARVFTNGSLSYIVTSVPTQVVCPTYGGPVVGVGIAPAGGPGGPVQPSLCTYWQDQVQVVDIAAGKARGSIALPIDPSGWYWTWGWGGFYYYDWYNGGDVVQVGTNTIAFRRWHPNYGPNGQFVADSDALWIVDLSNPDAPGIASVVVTSDTNGWWGNMKVVGTTLYTQHYEWPSWPYTQNEKVRYYIDEIDLSNPKNPAVKTKINVPGILVGGSQTDNSVIYTVDYDYDSNSNTTNEFDVLKLYGGKAYLQSRTALDGWVGNVFVKGNTAYTSTQRYNWIYVNGAPNMELHAIDITNPQAPVDRVASGPQGWGWLLGVIGDRLLVTSGWWYYGQVGFDVYKLAPNAAPAYDQFVRTLGWSVTSITGQNNQLFLSSGEWGVQTVNLQ
jgi:hypothetical protein